MGLVTSALAGFEFKFEKFYAFDDPSYLVGAVVIGILGYILIRVPLKNAGDPNEPAPPAAMM